jgi:lipopolysaccharide/colanic/teichoic acid biosynthesis glycosyltransferase
MPAATSERVHTVGSWNSSRGKRLFDLVFGSLVLLLSLPLLLVLAAVIKATSPGPALFRQKRVGRHGKEFEILKFRTMCDGGNSSGPGITRSGDIRVTGVGRLLRKFKLDELPQMINVARGDMSLVGPRPDLAKYILALDGAYRCVLDLKPGVTGMASLQFRDEEGVLSSVPAEELESYYVTNVLARKAQLDIEYARSASFLSDLGILLHTLLRIVQ